MGHFRRLQGEPDRPLDTTPVELPIGARRPASLQDYIARMVRDAVSAERGEEFESWEESDDFEEDDPDTLDFSQYELQSLQDEASIQDYGLEADPKFKRAQAPSEAPQETISGQPDPNAEPMKE